MTEYRVVDRTHPDFPGWVCIVCVEGGVETSASYAPPEVNVGSRLNMDHPTAVDTRDGSTVRWEMPTPEAAAWLEWSDDDLAAVRAAAESRGLL